jgi:phage tail sheath gpL-like
MTGLAIVGYPSEYRSPFTAAQILMGQGPSTAGAGEREALYVGPMTSAGTATPGVVYSIKTESDALSLAGSGAPPHRGIRTHLSLNKKSKVSVLLYAESSGAGATAANNTVTVTIAATNPTDSGTIRLAVCEEEIDIGFAVDSTVDTIGQEIEDKVNAKTHLPFTASNTTGTVTNLAKIAGASQNSIYRVRVVSVTPGKGVSVAVNTATLAGGVDGAVTENANLTAALAGIVASRYYYMGGTSPVQADIATLRAHIVTKSMPNPGLRCRGFAGYVGALSSLATIAIAQNTERFQIAWQLNSDHCPAQLAAALLAAHQLEESTDTACGLDGYSPPNWPIKPAASQADWPNGDDGEDAIVDGIVTIASNQSRSYIVMAATTRSKDSTGALNDFRATEPHRISVMDEFADTLVLRDQLTYANFKLRDDVYLADGTVDESQDIPKNTIVPSRYKSWVAGIIGEFVKAGKFQREDDWFDSLVVQIDPLNGGRLQVGVSGRVVDLKHQCSFLISETTPG